MTAVTGKTETTIDSSMMMKLNRASAAILFYTYVYDIFIYICIEKYDALIL